MNRKRNSWVTKLGDMEMKLNFRAVVISGALLAGGALAAAPAYADPLDSFVSCLNAITGPHTVADAVACVPAGCKTTVTMSEESAQPACALKDGTKLPRVLFVCQGALGSLGGHFLQFRPSFSLCTQAGTINHIEAGQDVNQSTRTDDPELRNTPYLQKMADFNASPSNTSWGFTEFGAGLATAVLDAKTPANSKGCADCHDRLGTVALPGGTANLFLPIPPLVAEGTIFTNDPAVDHLGVPTVNPLPGICTGIMNSGQLARSKVQGQQLLAYNLCQALAFKSTH